MAKFKRRERSYEEPDIAWATPNGSETRVYVLAEHEYMDWKTSTNHPHYTHGATVLIETITPWNRTVEENYVHDPNVWQWISRIMQTADSLGLKVLTPYEGDHFVNPNAKYAKRERDWIKPVKVRAKK